ncbi:MAG: divergent polysaccharide deacetylase family protein, partial [Candidatus Aminicenantes bacterium]|nr:divergent polysaccharide deacetylase family protein [Candidatus Aminicenantes bacterium]
MIKKRKKQKKKNLSLVFFILFITIAVFTVALLEYIDFKKGKESFIFEKIVPLRKVAAKTDDFNASLIKLLEQNKIVFEHFKDEKGKYHFKFTIGHKKFNGIISRIEHIAGDLKGTLELVEIRRIENKSLLLYSLKLDKEASHIILLTRIEKAVDKTAAIKKPEVQQKKPGKIVRVPRIAFIIDDIGEYDIGALELKRLAIPITASILPDSPRAHEEASWLKEYGLQAMLHIPMQPKNSNGQQYGLQQTITLDSSKEEIRELIRRAREIIPDAAGMNNHMGSLVTADKKTMKRILEIVKEEGLFFVDSKTIAGTVGYDTARNLGIKTAIRDVFLDDGEKSYEKSLNEIKRLVAQARLLGKAIAIGHPHETTLRA